MITTRDGTSGSSRRRCATTSPPIECPMSIGRSRRSARTRLCRSRMKWPNAVVRASSRCRRGRAGRSRSTWKRSSEAAREVVEGVRVVAQPVHDHQRRRGGIAPVAEVDAQRTAPEEALGRTQASDAKTSSVRSRAHSQCGGKAGEPSLRPDGHGAPDYRLPRPGRRRSFPRSGSASPRRTGIAELRRTTRDEPDYDKLMRGRLAILERERLGHRRHPEGDRRHATARRRARVPRLAAEPARR